MTLSRKTALGLLAVLLVLLFVGTQMPGAWRDEAFRVTRLPWQMTKVAHFASHRDPSWHDVGDAFFLAA